MKKIYSVILRVLFVTAIVILSACSDNDKKYYTEDGLPRFWTWLDYRESCDYDSLFSLYSSHGVRGVNVNTKGDIEALKKVIPIAGKYNVDVYVWFWGINQLKLAEKHPEWLDYNAKGESMATHKAYVDHYKFMNPAIPEFRKELEAQVEELCHIDGLKGISLDFTRYVDAILPEGIQPKYNIKQDKVYPEWDYGYHPFAIGKFKALYNYDPRELEDPTQDSAWHQFRLDQVTECVAPLVDIVHKHGMKISASPFPTPSLSRLLVMQDWDKWKLDFYQPMIYYGFYNQDYKWMGACTKEDVDAVSPAKVFSAIFLNDLKKDQADPKMIIRLAMDNGSAGLAFFGRPDKSFLESIKNFDK
ncbi:hypothetical protein FACS1894179_02700 [Bacteroidia bacterium]|nr:hypothetical protein FACS1894169_02880 [Bacteroidia bacterium]GHV38777.1 hypothetical protein FACS1894179_02700 [Bacteroidia bacterium]